MSSVSGVVGAIVPKRGTSKAGKPFTTYRVQVDGDWYGFGFNKPDFASGDVIEFEFQDGSYGPEHIKGTPVRKGAPGSAFHATPKAAPAKAGYSKEFPLPLLHPDRSIVRQNVLRHATQIVLGAPSDQPDAEVAERVIAVARILEQYATGYDVVESIAKEDKGE